MNTAALYIFFFDSSGVVPDTHDGGHYLHRKSAQKRHLALLAQEQKKLQERQILRQQLEKAAYGDPPSQQQPTKAEKRQITKSIETARNYEALIAALDLELLLIAEQMRIEAKRLREEDDIHALLLSIH